MNSFTADVERQCEAFGLHPYKVYSDVEAAEFLGIEVLRLKHLAQIGELKTVPGRKDHPYLGGHLAQYKAAKTTPAPKAARASHPSARRRRSLPHASGLS